MNKDKVLRISRYSFFIVVGILTLLFFWDIKFVVLWLNILEWDVVMAAIWMFVRLCQWAGRKNTGRRTLAVAALTLLGLFMLGSLCIYGEIPCYIEKMEPQTQRTFVAEYTRNILGRGSVKLYERFGPLLFACDVEEFVGEISVEPPEDRQISVSMDGKSIVVAYFFLWPIFFVPLE